MENWFVVRKLPDSIATNRLLRALIGSHRAQAWARYTTQQIAGLSVAMLLGLELGLVPMAASMVGIPLEVRHVTFVTGQLVYSGMQRGPEGVLHADYLMSLGQHRWHGRRA